MTGRCGICDEAAQLVDGQWDHVTGPADGHQVDGCTPDVPGLDKAIGAARQTSRNKVALASDGFMSISQRTEDEWIAAMVEAAAPVLLAEQAATIERLEAELAEVRDQLSAATEYTINAFPEPTSINAHHYEIKVCWRGPGKWAVMHFGQCLDIDGRWSHEPNPSSRTQPWKQAYRHDLATALGLAREAAPKITCNGMTAEAMWQWECDRHDEEGDIGGDRA